MKKFRELSEQHREKGRFKPTVPHNVSSTPGGTPRETSDSANVKLREAIKDKYDIGEYDQEGDMAKSDLRSIIANSKRVHDMLKDDDNLPEWVQSKITKAEDYMSTVANYLEAEMNEEFVTEESVPASKALQKAHEDERKRRGLPDPSYYLELMKKKKKEIEDMKKEEVEQIDEISAETAKRVAQARDKSAANYKLTPTQSRRLKMKDIGGDPDMNAAKALKSAMKRGAKNVYGEAVKMPKQTGAEKEYRRITGKTVDQRLSELDKIQKDLAKQKEDYIKQGIIKAESVEVDESLASTVGGLVGQYAGSKIGMEGPGKEHGALAGRMIDYHARKFLKKVKNKITGQKNESVELDEGKYGAFRVRMTSGGPKLPRRSYVPQGDSDPRTGLPLGFSNPPKSEKPEDKKMKKEEVESLEEKNVPTSPEKWSRAKAMAKQKFDVYPSAYANGWAAKKYKEMGGGWKSVSEEVEELDENLMKKLAAAGIAATMAASPVAQARVTPGGQSVAQQAVSTQKAPEQKKASVPSKSYLQNVASGKSRSIMHPDTAKELLKKHYSEDVDLEEGYFKKQETERQETERLAKRNEPPFTPDKPKKPSVVVGKKPEGYSRARQLARQALERQGRKPVKEAKEVSKKAKIVKDAMKKNDSDDKFQARPELGDSVTRNL